LLNISDRPIIDEMVKHDLFPKQMSDETNELYKLYLDLANPDTLKYVSKAEYRPTKGNATYKDVYKLNDKNQLLNDKALGLALYRRDKTGKSNFSAGYRDLYSSPHTGFGEYTLSLGHDKKGNYISYYDDYDLNTGLFGGHKQGDMFGRGISLYDRRYYDANDSINALEAAKKSLPAIHETEKRRAELTKRGKSRKLGNIYY